jgi:hypothetical protein
LFWVVLEPSSIPAKVKVDLVEVGVRQD